MSRYRDYGGWAPYVPVAERRRQAMREMEKLRKKGQSVAPVVIDGRTIATTFWGKAWCANLESYRDYENRLPRGRTYVRNGSVIDLQITSKEVRAMVSGSSIYQVKISVGALPQAVWQAICEDCSVGIDSLVELLQGRFNKGVMDRLCRQDNGLFPKPSEIKFSCSCPDIAYMCKHVAAVLYGIGSRLDERPELLFLLRAVNHTDLLAHIDTAVPLAKQGPDAGKLLETDDISQLFGLDMAEEGVGSSEPKAARPTAKFVDKPTPAKVPERRPAMDKPTPAKVSERRPAMDKPTPAKVPERRPAIETEQKKNVRQEIVDRIPVRKGAQEALYSQMQLLAQSAGFESIEAFLADQQGKQAKSDTGTKVSPGYRNPSNPKQTWSGHGRKPTWVLAHLDGGGRMEELEIG